MEACRLDPLFWINGFVWQFNPNSIGLNSTKIGPFVTWPYQDRAFNVLLDAIVNRHDVVIEKSREMGASWLCLLLFLHQAFFVERSKFLIISRDADAVDKTGEPDSLFWKLDYVLNNLPPWMTEGNCNPPGERDKKYRNVMSFMFPRTQSVISGQASTGKAGVGGRARAMFIDEFSQVKEDFEVYQRTSDTSACRIFNGTHKGVATAFYELTQDSRVRKLRMHWTEHPDKVRGLYQSEYETKKVEVLDKGFEFPKDYPFVADGKIRSPWYDEQCLRKGSERAVAIDLDINPEGAIGQSFDFGLVQSLIRRNCKDPLWTGDVEFDPNSGRFIRFTTSELRPRFKFWRPLIGRGVMVSSNYAIGVDNARGQGATETCMCILDMTTGEKVGEFADAFVKPVDVAPMLIALGWAFQNQSEEDPKQVEPAFLIWETTGPGAEMWETMAKIGYPRVFRRNKSTTTSDLNGKKQHETPGYLPNDINNTELMRQYESALRAGRFVNPSEAAMKETLLFKWNRRGRIEHSRIESPEDFSGARENHSDRAIADALACKLMLEFAVSLKVREDEVIHESSLAYRRQMHDIRMQERELWL